MPLPMHIQPVSPPPEVIHDLTIDRVIDGDTVTGRTILADTARTALAITIEQRVIYNGRVRLLSVNAYELKDPKGLDARDFVRNVLKPGDVIQTRAPRDLTDQYGRLVADLWYRPFNADRTVPVEYVNLAAELLARDLAVPMTGRKLQRLAPQLPKDEAEAFVAHVPSLLP